MIKRFFSLLLSITLLAGMPIGVSAAQLFDKNESKTNSVPVVQEVYKEGKESTAPGESETEESVRYLEASEEPIKIKITAWPTPYLVRVIDEQGEPVSNVHLYNTLPHIGDRGFYYATYLEKTTGVSDHEGFVTLWLPASYSMNAYVQAGDERIEESGINFDDLDQIDGCYQLVWKHPTPAELAEKAESGVQIEVVNKIGYPLSGIQVEAEEKEEIEGYHGFSGYTDQEGIFYSLTEPEGIELRLTLTPRDGGGEDSHTYYITPQPGRMNLYRVMWE